ncbi:MAG: hypothetical protein AB7S56_06095 [Halothiobacillaceae bacterium]
MAMPSPVSMANANPPKSSQPVEITARVSFGVDASDYTESSVVKKLRLMFSINFKPF